MATVIENRPQEEKGMGLVGVIAIILVVILAAFFLFRFLGTTGNDADVNTGAEVNVSGSLGETEGSF